jgi:hypothetical protein
MLRQVNGGPSDRLLPVRRATNLGSQFSTGGVPMGEQMGRQVLELITDQAMMSSLQVGAVFFIVGLILMVIVSGSSRNGRTRRKPPLRPYDDMKLRQAQNR